MRCTLIDVVHGEEGWHEKVDDRFAKRQWPQEKHLCRAITLKCWQKEYESAEEVVGDIKALR